MNLFYELIQVAVGTRDILSRIPSAEEWQCLFAASQKQSLVGICFQGINLMFLNNPEMVVNLPGALKMKWMAMTFDIQRRNSLIMERARELSRRFAEDGYRSTVLKGVGVSKYYPDPSLRQGGDIDLWVDGERDDTILYMRARYKCGRAVIHHIDVEVFDDVPVEVHFVPSFTYSMPRYRAYKRFFNEYKEECFVPSGLGFCVPSLGFNVVYLLMHIFRHVFHEGIGLRQLMDYYFLLMTFHGTHEEHRDVIDKAIQALKELGLLRFAGAVMYVEREVFGLQEEYMICEPNEKAGRFLLDEIMRAGNFGKYDPRIREAHSGGMVKLYIKNVTRIFGMLSYYPSEVLWSPFWKIGHFIWRKVKGY